MKKNKIRNSKNFLLILFVILFIISFIYLLKGLDKYLLPAALEAADVLAKARINTAINSCVSEIISEDKLSSKDFYEASLNENGKINSISVNTILVNNLCNDIGEGISQSLSGIENQVVGIPYGSLTGIRALANTGPLYKITILPMGDAVVDYSSSFESVGINQVNFQIWLNINARIKIINPVHNTEVNVVRNVPLVNTVINSEIPEAYFSSDFFGK